VATADVPALCRLTVLPSFTAFDVRGDRSDEAVQARLRAHLVNYAEQLERIETMKPVPFNVWADWDENGQLKPGVQGHSLVMRAER